MVKYQNQAQSNPADWFTSQPRSSAILEINFSLWRSVGLLSIFFDGCEHLFICTFLRLTGIFTFELLLPDSSTRELGRWLWIGVRGWDLFKTKSSIYQLKSVLKTERKTYRSFIKGKLKGGREELVILERRRELRHSSSSSFPLPIFFFSWLSFEFIRKFWTNQYFSSH